MEETASANQTSSSPTFAPVSSSATGLASSNLSPGASPGVPPMVAQAKSVVVCDCECVADVEPPYSFDRCWQVGIGVFVTWSARDGFKDWLWGEGEKVLAYLSGHDLVAGYNVLRFDFRVLDGDIALSRGLVRSLDPAKAGPEDPPEIVASALKGRVVDMLVDVTEVLGHRLKLNQILEATFGRAKIMDGADAPRKWRDGRRFEVIQYCRDDVSCERDVYLHLASGRPLMYADRYRGPRTVPIKSWKVR